MNNFNQCPIHHKFRVKQGWSPNGAYYCLVSFWGRRETEIADYVSTQRNVGAYLRC